MDILRGDPAKQNVLVGSRFRLENIGLGRNSTGWETTLGFGTMHEFSDPLLAGIQDCMIEYVMQSRAAHSVEGWVTPPSREVLLGQAPVNTPYDPLQDSRTHGNLLSGIHRLAHSAPRSDVSEKDVYHASLHGSLAQLPGAIRLPGFFSVGWQPHPDLLATFRPYITGLGCWKGYASNGTFTSVGWNATPDYRARAPIVSVLEGISHAATGPIRKYTFWNQETDDFITDVRWDISGDGSKLSIDWCHTIHRWGWFRPRSEQPSYTLSFRRALTIECLPYEPPIYPSNITGWCWVYALADIRYSSYPLTGSLTVFGDDLYGVTSFATALSVQPDWEVERLVYPWVESPVLISTYGSGQPVVTAKDLMDSLIWEAKHFTERVWYDLTPSTFYSTADAVGNYTDVVETNWLETLAEGAQIVALVPDLGKFARLIAHLAQGRWFRVLADSLDLASYLVLLEAFGWSPMSKAIDEAVVKYDSIVARLTGVGVWGPRTLYGSFIRELGSYAGFSSLKLTARTKCRVIFDDTTLYTLLLGSKALGVTPDLAGLWDIVPFSFVVDWFANVGDRLEAIDDQSMLMLLPHIYSVHSMTIEFTPTQEQLSQAALMPLNCESPTVRLYFRWLSYYLSPLKESQFDFLEPESEPPLKLGASLLWQIFGAK